MINSAILLLAMIVSFDAYTCTSVAARGSDSFHVGQNYDFALTHGAVFINQAGVEKESLIENKQNRFTWVAKYPSITLSQFGQELPASGMNGKGLVVQMLWNEDEQTPKPKSPTGKYLNELQWVQYQLDNYATTAEVISQLGTTEILKSFADLHYVVCDIQKTCALVEFVNGKLTAYGDQQYSPSVITNSSLVNSLKHYDGIKTLPYKDVKDKKRNSLNYYARAVHILQNSKEKNFDTAKHALSEVHSDYRFMDIFKAIFSSTPPSVTAWTAIFNPSDQTLHLSTDVTSEPFHKIELKPLSKRCGKTLALEFEKGQKLASNLASTFSDDARKVNQSIVYKAYRTIEDEFPKESQDFLINYPSTFTCKAL